MNEINENSNKHGEKSPLKYKIFDFYESQELKNSDSDTNLLDSCCQNEDVEDFNSNLQNKRSSNTRELLSFAIPEEAEETNLSTNETNKEK